MIITSSRKPSASTRTLCKHLASFFACEYFNRGKMGMGEVLSLSHDKPLLIVGEYHGNPGSISFYDLKGYCVLSLHISVLSAPSSYPRQSGSIVSIDGDSDLARAMNDVLLLKNTNDASPLSIGIVGNRMDFKEQGSILFSLRIISHKLYNGDSDCN